MRQLLTALLIFVFTIPLAACAEPEAQTATPVESAPAAAADPAELLPKGKSPADGVLTGGQPSDAQLEALADLGYTTVINLRGAEENGSTDPALVESLGMTYVSIPMTSADDVSQENAQRLAEAMAAAEGPVLVHCASANRVGALMAMKAYHLDGASPEESLALAQEVGVTRLEPVVRQRLGLE